MAPPPSDRASGASDESSPIMPAPPVAAQHRMTAVSKAPSSGQSAFPSLIQAERPIFQTIGILAAMLAVILVFAIPLVGKGQRSVAGGQTGTSAGSPPAATKVPPTPTLTPTPTIVPLPGLATQGVQLIDASGKPIRLIGLNHASFEYSCQGDHHYQIADFQAMKSWGTNTVRIPLSSIFWFDTHHNCPNYRQSITQAVSNARAVGLYVILVLQWNGPIDTPLYRNPDGTPNWQYPMPDSGNDAQMWRDLAGMYKNDQTVLFDLFGEPTPASWNLWENGGTVYTAVGSYHTPGMRGLYTIVRQIAPSNIIIMSGINWGFDLTGLTQGYAIPDATNVMYGSHPWSHWGSVSAVVGNFSAASQHYPVIITEFGEYDNGTAWNGQIIQWFNAHHLSWIAWNWAPDGGSTPVLLSDWNGKPIAPYGTFIHDQMLAAARAGA